MRYYRLPHSDMISSEPGAMDLLDKVADAILECSEYNIIVKVHTDGKGSDQYNQELEERWSKSVKGCPLPKPQDAV